MCSMCYRNWLKTNPSAAAATNSSRGPSVGSSAPIAIPKSDVESHSGANLCGASAPGPSMTPPVAIGSPSGMLTVADSGSNGGRRSCPGSVDRSSALGVPGVGGTDIAGGTSATPPMGSDTPLVSSPSAGSAVPDSSKCGVCSRKLGLTPFVCRCSLSFCAKHRYPDEHGCTVDYKALGREELMKNNPVVKASKVQKI